MSENAQARWHLTEGDTIEHSSLAQSVEHLTVNQVVAGSSPAGGANTKDHSIGWSFVLAFSFEFETEGISRGRQKREARLTAYFAVPLAECPC